jgi:hypothetical protein
MYLVYLISITNKEMIEYYGYDNGRIRVNGSKIV